MYFVKQGFDLAQSRQILTQARGGVPLKIHATN
jgi:hypothetical protein